MIPGDSESGGFYLSLQPDRPEDAATLSAATGTGPAGIGIMVGTGLFLGGAYPYVHCAVGYPANRTRRKGSL
jgi:hypothetical protein